MKFLIIGKCFFDINIPLEKNIESGLNINISNYEKALGGFSLIATKILHNLEAEVNLATVIGNDTYGKNILVNLKNSGINTECVEINYEDDTLIRHNYINIKNNTWNTIKFIGKDLNIKNPKFTQNPTIILTDGSDINASTFAFNQFGSAIKILSINENYENLTKISKYFNYIIINQDLAEKFSNLKFDYNDNSSFIKIYQFLKDSFKAQIIITLNNKGILYNLNNQVKIMPKLKVNTISSIFSHDVFVAAFSYYIGLNKTLEEAINFGNIVSSLSTTRFGSNSFPTKAEIQKIILSSQKNSSNLNSSQNNKQVVDETEKRN